jgi:hypothetical protein
MNNYESYFLDYLDGNLDPELVPEFIAFLAQNPGLADELYETESCENISFKPETLIFEGKDRLKKNIVGSDISSSDDFDELCVAKLEGDLSEEMSADFDKIISQNPNKQKIFNQYAKTILKPDFSIIYPGKSKLKKFFISKRQRNFVLRYVAVAATVIIILGLCFIMKEKPALDTGQIATEEKNVQKTPLPKTDFKVNITKSPKNITSANPVNPLKNKQETRHATSVIPAQLNTDINYIVLSINKPAFKSEPELRRQESYISTINTPEVQNIIPNNSFDIQANNEYFTLGQYFSKFFSQKILKQDKENKFDLWTIADLSIKEIGKLTETEIVLTKQCADPGCKTVTYALNTNRFEFSTKKNK